MASRTINSWVKRSVYWPKAWVVPGLAALFVVLSVVPGRSQSGDTTSETMEQVVVEGKRLEGRTDKQGALRRDVSKDFQASKTVNTVSGTTARDYNSVNSTDAMRMVPGVSFIYGGSTRFSSPTTIRGAGSGGPVSVAGFEPLSGFSVGEGSGGLSGVGAIVPSIAVTQQRVVKGSLGVQYGDRATGGMMVTELKKGKGKPSGSVYVESNPLSEQLYQLEYGAGTPRYDYYFAGRVLEGEYEDVTAQPFTQFVSSRFTELESQTIHSGVLRTGYNPTKSSRLELLALKGDNTANFVATNLNTAPPNTDRKNESLTDFYGLNFDYELTPRLDFQAEASTTKNEFNAFNLDNNSRISHEVTRQETLMGALNRKSPLTGTWSLSQKIGAEKETFTHSNGTEYDERSLILMNTLQRGKRLKLNLGTRYVDLNDVFSSKNLFVWDAGVSYRLAAPKTKLKLSYSTGYDRVRWFPYFFPNPEGKHDPKRSRTVEAGLVQPLFNMNGTQFGQISVTVYDLRIRNNPTFSGWPSTVYNEDAQTKGVELSGRVKFNSRLALTASLADQRNRITAHDNPNQHFTIGSSQVPIPETTGSIGLNYRYSDKLRFHTIATYDDGQRRIFFDNSSGTPVRKVRNFESFVRWNANVEYKHSTLTTVNLRLENILDNEAPGFGNTVQGPSGSTTTEPTGHDPGFFASLSVSRKF